MNLWTKTRIVASFLQWRATWDWHDSHYRHPGLSDPRFMTAREAVALIPDGAVLADSGLGATQRASILYWAIRESFLETGHPRDLTVISVGGHGGRGRIPGTLEEVGIEGLCRRFITGHTETYKAMLRLAERGVCDVHVLPQGTIALLIAAQAEGQDNIVHGAGLGTFLDPRCGRGSPLTPGLPDQFVSLSTGHQLCYTCPTLTAAMFNLPAADRAGNLYAKNAAMIGEAWEAAHAVKRNGGVVIANVGLVVDEGYDDIFLPASMIDAIVVDPHTEQTAGVPHRKYWPCMTTGSTEPLEEGLARVRLINKLVGVTPQRTPADEALARLAAKTFVAHAHPGIGVDIGVGLPEEVSRLLFETGLLQQMRPLTETGVHGGTPAPGVFFGTAVNPTEIVSSAEAFRRMYRGLDAVILGMLEADSAGNVNVSLRGEGPINYVGPGGFIDITHCANLVIFVGTWMAHADLRVRGGQVHIARPGTCKFVDRVREITFSGAEALAREKLVYYVTNVGVFRLTHEGMRLEAVVPGIDVARDIVGATKMKVIWPEGGVEIVNESVITGRGFALAFGGLDASRPEGPPLAKPVA